MPSAKKRPAVNPKAKKVAKNDVEEPIKKKGAESLTQADLMEKLRLLIDECKAVNELEKEVEVNDQEIEKLELLNEKMTKAKESLAEQNRKKERAVGVIRVDYDYPPIPGDVDWPGSFDYKTRQIVCPGLTFEIAQKGTTCEQKKEKIKRNLANCVNLLRASECVGITADCGFMQHYQEQVGLLTDLPVFLSSLMQCAFLASTYQDNEKILVITANGKSLNREALRELLATCHLREEVLDQFIIMGCEDGKVPGFEAVAEGNKVDAEIVSKGIVRVVNEYIKENGNIKAILLECTELPAYGDTLREKTGLPVFDAVTLMDYFYSATPKNQ